MLANAHPDVLPEGVDENQLITIATVVIEPLAFSAGEKGRQLMPKSYALLFATIFLCLMAASAVGQQGSGREQAPAAEAAKNRDPSHFYRLEFVVRESDQGKVLNQRTYSLGVAAAGTVESREWWTLRAGTKVPVTNNNYTDVGFNTDVRADDPGGGSVQLRIKADLSSALPIDAPTGAMPTIRQMRVEEAVVVPIGRPTVVFSGEDPASRHQFQLEVSVLPQK